MSTVAVNEITDEVGTGSPAFTNGLAQSDIAGALNATGTAPIYACRAWVNFDGTTATIRDSGNVSSITKNGTGDYTINFATAMSDNDYAINFCVSNTDDNWASAVAGEVRGFMGAHQHGTIPPDASSFRIETLRNAKADLDGSKRDFSQITVAVFR